LIITVVEGFLPLWMGILLECLVGSLAIGAATLPFLHSRPTVATASIGGYIPPPSPVFTPPSAPPPPGPPAVPQ
jgi:hypothetical protein